MIEKLFIIGNGFDIHHCLKTKYSDFATHLKSNNDELYETLENYIDYPQLNKDLWANFENNLANLDTDELLSDYSYLLPEYASEEFSEGDRHIFPDTMDEYYRKLTDGLFESFQDFILGVCVPKIAHELKLQLDINAIYLTFNYTNTLEKLYQIDKRKILYIHNSAYYGSGDIILGHGIDPEKFEESDNDPPPNLDGEELEKWYNENVDWDYSYDTGKETIMEYFRRTYKPTKEIIAKNQSFFSNLHWINNIYVLGHSLSTVDLPYFEEILKYTNPDAKWFVSYYCNAEIKKHLDTLNYLGIDKNRINLFKLEEIQQKNVQLRIDFKY